MRIQVFKIVKKENATLIHFSSEYGNAFGVWMGQDFPEIKEYFVEFDMDESFVFGENIHVCTNDQYAIYCDEQHFVHMRGNLEVNGNDNYCLRIGKSVMLLDIIGVLPPHITWVELTTAELRIFDTHII
jgi:hypothetical protein